MLFGVTCALNILIRDSENKRAHRGRLGRMKLVESTIPRRCCDRYTLLVVKCWYCRQMAEGCSPAKGTCRCSYFVDFKIHCSISFRVCHFK